MRLFLVLLLVFGGFGAALTRGANAQSPAVTEATIEVLEELADEGVVDALYQLADLAAREDTEAYFDDGAGFRYLTLSAASGRASAVRWLAYRLALETDAETEAATLLAASALMGDDQAVNDLRLWPLLGPVDEDEMLAGFDAAMTRLAEGRLIDCEHLPFDCPANLSEVTAMDASTVLRASAWRNRPRSKDIETVMALFGPELADHDAFPDSRYRQFLAEQHRDNRPIREALSRSGGDSEGDRDWETRAYLDRRRMRTDTASSYLQSTRASDLGRYSDELEAGLDTVNRHRAKPAKIDAEALRDGPGGKP